MGDNVATLQMTAMWVLLITAILFLPIMVYVLSARDKKSREDWLPEPVAKGIYYQTEVRRIIFGSVYSTMRFTDGTHITVVNVNLPVPGTYIEVYTTKKRNNFKIKTPIPPSSCL